MNSKLALYGGTPVRIKPFPSTITTGAEEVEAAIRVIRSGLLSGFVGSPSPEFLGGPSVRAFEGAWASQVNVKHGVSCNSATSALVMAIGAAGVGPGDEVIVSPYTMSATATAVLFYGGIPVFADIEPNYFCLDPKSVESKITRRTKVILTTDIHGQSSNMDALNLIAKKHDLKVIVDCAQSPGATINGKASGTDCDIGIFSFNRHKNLQCGEGGIAVTNDDEMALRMRLIRNHGENLVESDGFKPLSLANMIGHNFRMTEIEAAIAHEQVKKIDILNSYRLHLVQILEARLSKIPFLQMPAVRPGATHVYYMHIMLFDEEIAGVTRSRFLEAVRAEGIPIWGGYMRPLYMLPMFQKKMALGERGFPFVGPHYDGHIDYAHGLCPVAEDLYMNRTIVNPFVYPPLDQKDISDIIDGIQKVTSNINDLK